MMRKKTRSDVAQQEYFNQADLMKLFGWSQNIAHRTFLQCDKWDSELEFRVEPYKISMKSLCRATGLTRRQIRERGELDERRNWNYLSACN